MSRELLACVYGHIERGVKSACLCIKNNCLVCGHDWMETKTEGQEKGHVPSDKNTILLQPFSRKGLRKVCSDAGLGIFKDVITILQVHY